MLDFQQKRKLRSVMYHRTTLIVLSILVIIAIRSTWSVYSKQRESDDQKRAIEQKTTELVSRDDLLQRKIENIKTEHGIEEEIRTKFSVAKTDENVVIVLDNDTTTESTVIKKTIWQKIKNIFGF